MASERFSKCFLLALLALLTTCSYVTLAGFSYLARDEAASSAFSRTLSFLRNSLVNNKIPDRIVEDSKFHSLRRELSNNLKTTSHDAIPNVVTVPSTNPVTITPSIPTATPVTVPSTNPNNPTVPITNPTATPSTPITVPGAQPVTNPVITNPTPTGGVPVSTPAVPPPATTNPTPTGGVPVSTPAVPPPETTNAPAAGGQSWCVAKTGASQPALQLGLDYACGHGADCSQIQQGANCFSPNSLQNHASYAFNSYYQKNPAATSCDFGGTATVVNANPSTGSCVYPSSALSSTTPTVTPGTGVSSSGNQPGVLNSSSPPSGYPTGFGSNMPPTGLDSSTSASTHSQPLIKFIVLVSAIVDGMIILVV